MAMAVVSVLPAIADVNPADYQEIELGKEYPMVQYKSFRGRYTATEKGQIIEYAHVPVFLLKSGQLELITEEEGYKYAGYINGKQAYQFPVNPGVTYYFEDSFVMDDGVFSIEMNPELHLLTSEPKVGTVYNPAVDYCVQLVFNQNINIGKATLSVGTLSSDVETHSVGSTVSVMINDDLRQWYNADKIKGGDEITVTLSSLTDGLGTPIEDQVFKYVASAKPVEMTSAELPAEILSWYGEENAAKAVFTFTGAMAADQSIQLCYAPVELGYEYTENLAAKVEGNTITVDFGGVRRTSEDMSTSGRTDAQIYLILNNLKDAEGNTVWSDGQGTIGSYMFEIPFAEIPRLDITSEFTPSLGSSLENAKNVKIYFTCADHLTYEGVAFTSGTETIVVTEGITVDRISDSETELTVPIPAGWNTKENVYVSLYGLVTDDGFDHSSELSAKFNGFTLIFCSIKNGSRVKSLTKGTIVKVETNLGADDKLTFEIVDKFGPANMTPFGDGVFMLTMPETVIFEKDEIFTVNFTATPGGVESLTIYGDTAPYEYSDLELTDITPADGSDISADTKIRLTFTGLVQLLPVEGSVEFSAVSNSVDDDSNYGYEWALTLNNVQEGKVTLAFSAMDMDYNVVKGNTGVDAESHFVYTFNVTSAGIIEISAKESGMTFDLQGRPAANPSKGIFIRNGKKIKL